MPIRRRISFKMGIWVLSSSGVGRRPALYSSYLWCRKVGPCTSKATAIWLGFRSTSFRSMPKKPWSAPVGVPSRLVMGVCRAKNARYIRLFPSITIKGWSMLTPSRWRTPEATAPAFQWICSCSHGEARWLPPNGSHRSHTGCRRAPLWTGRLPPACA